MCSQILYFGGCLVFKISKWQWLKYVLYARWYPVGDILLQTRYHFTQCYRILESIGREPIQNKNRYQINTRCSHLSPSNGRSVYRRKRAEAPAKGQFARYWLMRSLFVTFLLLNPDSKVHGPNMGPIWGRQGPGGPHVGPVNFTVWESYYRLSCQALGIGELVSVLYAQL